MTRNDYEVAIRIFLRELSPAVLTAGSKEFASLELRREVNEARRAFADKAFSDVALIGIAAGLVEEYVTSDWDRIIEIAFSSYETDRRASSA